MALEEIEINKDNLNVDTFKTLIANVAEQINIKLQNEEGIPLEDIDKSVTQINNAYSMLVTVNSDTNDRDISAIEQMKVNFDNAILDIQTKLDNGYFDGKDGKDGQSFTFDMFTPEQLDSLKVKGDDGQPFTYDMFTPEQLDSLKVKGDDGQPFTYDMFTPEQLDSLKVKGDDGTPFTYDDLTDLQKKDLLKDSGKVLQVLTNPILNETVLTISVTSEVEITSWEFDIVKKKSDSTILCFMSWYGYYSSSPSYWSIKAYANGVGVTSAKKTGDSTYIDNAVLTHNQNQYTFFGPAHQHFSSHFYDNTDSKDLKFTYSFMQTTPGVFNIWNYGCPVFIYIEIAK